MTSSIPDRFSMDDLQDLIKNAQSEPENNAASPHYLSEITDMETYAETVQELVVNWLNELSEPLEAEDAMIVHKAIMHVLIEKMIGFHSKGGLANSKDGDYMAGMCWSRDAGKFQAMAVILSGIYMGDKDFLCDCPE